MNNNQVAIREDVPFETLITDVEMMQRMCASLMKTKHYSTMGEAGIFAIVQKARSLNVPPLDALNGGLYYVNGKVGMSSEMMASLIRQKGHSIVKDSKSNAGVCILHGKRADNGDTWTCEFSMEDARRAGIAKNMYEKYPAIMLYNRCMSMLARQLFPDVIKGAGYTREELMEIKPNPTPTYKPIMENEYVEIITTDQAHELDGIISECSVDYQGQIISFLKKSGINGFSQLPASLYDRLITAALRKREEHSMQSTSEEQHEQAMGE